MSLRDFIVLYRDQIIEACRAELRNARAPEQIAEDFRANLEELARGAIAAPQPNFVPLVGESTALASLRTRIDQLSSRSRAPIWISGETGVGKRHTARALHHATYPDGAWFDLQGARELQELDGHLLAISKSTSIEAEVGTTIYVHEIPEAEAQIQARVARLLQDQSLPCRIVVSSIRPLAAELRNVRLPSDLAFRFSNELKLPPLRERKQDIRPLVEQFAARCAANYGYLPTRLSADAFELLLGYSWPGNAAELEKFVDRLTRQFGPAVVEASDLPILGDGPSGVTLTLTETGVDLAELERQLLVQALALASNNQTRAASLLGLTRDQMRYRMAKFDLLTPGARGK